MLSLILGERIAGKLLYDSKHIQPKLTALLWFIYCDTDNIFSSGKLPCLASKQGVQRVGCVCCGGLDGIRGQLANVRCQVLITLLAGKDSTEAQWSALSPHSKKSAEFGSWPFLCHVLSVVCVGFLSGQNSILAPHRNKKEKQKYSCL